MLSKKSNIPNSLDIAFPMPDGASLTSVELLSSSLEDQSEPLILLAISPIFPLLPPRSPSIAL